MELIKIKDNVQQTAEAISGVMGVDVTVTDKNLVRIAGTGKYKSCIGEMVNEQGVFAYCLKEGTPYIVRNPKEMYVCNMCTAKYTCMEYAEIVCPIMADDEICGLIGLIAFDQEQKERLLQNEKNTLDFLDRMSNLLGAKLIDLKKTQEIKLLMSQLQTIINVMDKSLIITDYIGCINYYNEKADYMFDIKKKNIIDVKHLFGENYLNGLFDKGPKIENKEFEYKKNDNMIKGIITTETVFDENKIKSVVFVIDELSQLINLAKNIISPSIVTEFDNIIYDSKIMNDIIKLSKKISNTDSTVLITGESGTGKELFARAIHYDSRRSEESFIAINCSAIPENLFESELFGYEEGSFTGAMKGGRPGKFELADKGTLLLDEIGDMPIHLQPKLLRVLQDGKVMRIGGKNYIPVDVRIMASTNADLEEKVKNKEFREDLYYRLNVIPINIPPLRERREDIQILAQHFVAKYGRKMNKEVYGLDENAMNYLKSYPWNGNVRELENVIEYAVNMTERKYLTVDNMPLKIKKTSNVFIEANEKVKENEVEYILSVEELEKRELKKAIEKYGRKGSSVDRICSILGIGRATFYRKIKKYSI